MAESALKIPKFKIMGDALKVYNKVNGVAQEGATTQAAMMDFFAKQQRYSTMLR